MGIKESISELRQKFDADLSEVRDSESIEKLRVSYLGKKGSVTELLKTFPARKKKNSARPSTRSSARSTNASQHTWSASGRRRKTALSTAQSNMMSRCR